MNSTFNNLSGINSEKCNKQQQLPLQVQANHNGLQGNVIASNPNPIASNINKNNIINKDYNSNIGANISRIDRNYASSWLTEGNTCNGKGHYVFNYNGTIGYVDAKSIDAQLIMIAYDDKEYRVTR